MRDYQEVRYILARPRPQRQASHVRARRWLFILAAVVLYLPSVGISIAATISGDHYWGLDAVQIGDTSTWRVTCSDRGLSSGYNIQPGDQVLQADGQAPQSVQQINQATKLEILRLGQIQPELITWQAPNQLNSLLSISWIVLGAVSLLLGLLVFLHATDRTLALRFFFLWIILAIASSLVPATTFGNLLAVHLADALYDGPGAGLLLSFLWLLLFPLTPHTSLSSPSAKQQLSLQTGSYQHARHRWLPEIPVVVGALIAPLLFTVLTLERASLLQDALLLSYANVALAVCGSLFLLVRAGLSRRRTIARERARTLFGGMLLGLIPPLVLTVLPSLITGQPLVPGTISALSIIALPLSFAYAIVRRDLLRLDSLIRNTTLALLGIIGMAIVAVLLAQVLALLPPTLAIIIGIVAGAVLAPLIWVGARWLTEAWLFPQVRQYRKLIAQGETSERTGLDPLHLAWQLLGEVHLALPVRRVAVFAPDKHTGRLVALPAPQTSKPGEQEAISSLPKGDSPAGLPPATQEQSILFIDDSVYHWLSREGKTAIVEPLPANWPIPASTKAKGQRTSRPLQASTGEDAQDSSNQLDLESWHLLVPMRVRGRLVGILALSRREDEQAYSDTDLRLLRFLAGRRALALDYALLYADLHHAFEERRELDRLKDRFIVTAHHELRTPLTGIQGYLELLRQLGPEGRAARPEEVSLFIERACQATDQLGEQLNGLLTAVEATLNQDHLKSQPVEVHKVAQRAMRALSAVAQRGHHRIHNEIPPELVVIGDQEALYRVLLNLLSNALKYNIEGRPVLFKGRARVLPASGGREPMRAAEPAPSPTSIPVAEILVRDWGVGIAKSDQHKIFERFTRLERDLNSPVRGNGLGLAICKELVEAMGGTIWVESDGRRGEGSTFFVRLPLAEPVSPALPFSG